MYTVCDTFLFVKMYNDFPNYSKNKKKRRRHTEMLSSIIPHVIVKFYLSFSYLFSSYLLYLLVHCYVKHAQDEASVMKTGKSKA